jgi:ABC-type uncharacterized transport system ATPase subunit
VLIKSNGVFTHLHYAELLKQQELLKPLQDEQSSVETARTEETTEKQQRVKVIRFFGKVLDCFPGQTSDDRTIYKLLIGNDVKQEEESKNTTWTVVTALELHVVKFLQENLDTFEERKTRLCVEGYYQEVLEPRRKSEP